MKAVYLIILMVGIVLAFGTESLDMMSNLTGLCMMVYACEKLNLFYNKFI